MSASIVPVGKTYSLKVGADAVTKKQNRNVYVHLTEASDGKSKSAKLKVGDVTLSEGDAAMVTKINAGEELTFESIGDVDAEVVVLDSD
jgi:hypothetical protein